MSVPITTLAARSTMSLLYALVPPRFHRFARLRSGLLIRCKFRPVPWSGRDHEEASTDGAKPVSEPQSFPIEKIHVPEKKRKALKPEIVEDIAESILDVGQQDAILVRRGTEQDRSNPNRPHGSSAFVLHADAESGRQS